MYKVQLRENFPTEEAGPFYGVAAKWIVTWGKPGVGDNPEVIVS